MTCIAGWVEGATVWMGADSAISHAYMLRESTESKLVRRNGILFGVAGDTRAKAILAHNLEIPARKKSQVAEAFIAIELVNAIRVAFKESGMHTRKDEHESVGVTLLIAYESKLYIVGGSYAVYRTRDNFAAIGSGAELASGALYALKDYEIKPRERLTLALRAAAHFNPYVAKPFVITSL